MRFEEKIIYKSRQHWIVPLLKSLKYIGFIALPFAFVTYFVADFSWVWTIWVFLLLSVLIAWYDHYLWSHSWLMIGNQKITLSVRNGIFSQFAMNIRYRNIRDCAVSKNSVMWYLLKYGTLFIRASSGSDGDFTANHVPKVGKIYALINALSRYSDDDRADIDSIEKLHAHHTSKEFTTTEKKDEYEEIANHLKFIPGVTETTLLLPEARQYILEHEEARNHGVLAVLKKNHVICLLHDSLFREAGTEIVSKTLQGDVFFPTVPFPELGKKNAISASPSQDIHTYLLRYFPYATHDEATVLVGWDE